MPRVVSAGVPTRMPLVTIGFSGSKGIMFLLTVIPALPSASSATLPVSPTERTSTSSRWLSVPPETRRSPPLGQRLRRAPCAFVEDPLLVDLELRAQRLAEGDGLGGDDVHQRTALDAREDLAVDGLGVGVACERIRPPRGPRSVLWVVVVTMSA